MHQKVLINDLIFDVTNFHEEKVMKEGKELIKVSFDFKVKSEDYHEVTTLLYLNDFIIKVPGTELEFPATIYNYSTSITNLYKENEVGDFKLELIENV
ncbi:hypothetical protein CIL05_05030 [Virgibacillus profundi]|uniref:DUF3219 domain-containing protein n=1 Tax=Virgibacillus profundi TaxID=2024555 RepID=A0A2A2IH42_9BACI|nr:DUF3219 family protein [Virgibacillus profundi]PAV30470.1 hypothetical protein CIL05_05030 [Virgibacillus profundi]PXY54642.1 DUF3219 domain-containing protein [Virgibacillus profundi]